MSITLRMYFILILSIFVIIFTTVISFTINKESSKSVEKHISNSLTEKAFQMADQLDHFMWSRYGEITVLSKLETLQNPQDEKEISNLLNELKANFPSYSWIGYTDAKGNVRASTDDILLGADISERPVFKDARDHTFIGDVHEAVLLAKLLPNPSGEPLQFVDISSPIFNDKNEFIGVLAAHLSWEWADEVRKSVIQPLEGKEENLDVFIISKKDNTVLLGPKSMIGQPLMLDAVAHAQSGQNNWSLEEWPDEKNYLTGYAIADGFLNYPGLDWTVLVRQPKEVAFYSVKELSEQVIKLGIIFTILFALLGWLFASIISNPLRQLVITAEKLKNGEKVEIPVKKGIRDIETLATSLRDLISTLTRTKIDLGQMELKAHLDKLTELPNRRALDEYLTNLNKSTLHTNKQYGFLYLDLDGFKHVNDRYGHHHGDLLLKEVATRIGACLSKTEIICRLGGDEFVIIIETTLDNAYEDIKKVGNCVIEEVNRIINIEDNSIHVGCSIGAAVWPKDDRDSYQVLRYADKALYVSKENGKNQLSHFNK